MKDYQYVEDHLSEYAEEYNEVKMQLQVIKKQYPNVYEQLSDPEEYRMTLNTLHKILIDKGKEQVPEHCWCCPFHNSELSSMGLLLLRCAMNTGHFDPKFIQGGYTSDAVPDWCPFKKQQEEGEQA